MANNFKVFAEDKQKDGVSTVLTDTELSNDGERQSGSVPDTIIRSKLVNTGLREATLLSTALINALEQLDTRTNPGVTYSPGDSLSDFTTKLVNVIQSFTKDYANAQVSVETTNRENADTALGLRIDKAVVYNEAQALTTTQQLQARTNIGAGTSSFSGSYTDLTNKPTYATVATSGRFNDLTQMPYLYVHNIKVIEETFTHTYEMHLTLYTYLWSQSFQNIHDVCTCLKESTLYEHSCTGYVKLGGNRYPIYCTYVSSGVEVLHCKSTSSDALDISFDASNATVLDTCNVLEYDL